MLLKYEFKKLFGHIAVKVVLLLVIAFSIYFGLENNIKVTNSWLAVFKTAEDKITIENYVAVLTKAQSADPFFWEIEMNNQLFDRQYIMTSEGYGYKKGEKINYIMSPIYKTTNDDLINIGYNSHDINSAYGALFSQYKEFYNWEENRKDTIKSAEKYYNWFVKRDNITTKARTYQRKAILYNKIVAPEQFITNVHWSNIFDSFINNKASFLFIIIAIAYLFGQEKKYSIKNLLMVTKKRTNLLFVKILCCLLISLAIVLLEVVIITAVNFPGGYYPKMFSARIQNVFPLINSPFNMSIFSFALMIVATCLLVVISVSAITAFTVSIFKSISGSALVTAFIVFIPLLFNSLYSWTKYAIPAYKSIYDNSIMVLNNYGTWCWYISKSVFNIPFMLYEYVVLLWTFIGVFCLIGCALLYNKRNN